MTLKIPWPHKDSRRTPDHKVPVLNLVATLIVILLVGFTLLALFSDEPLF